MDQTKTMSVHRYAAIFLFFLQEDCLYSAITGEGALLHIRGHTATLVSFATIRAEAQDWTLSYIYIG